MLGSVVVMLAMLLSALPASIAQATDEPEFQLHVPVLYYHHVECPSATTKEPEYFICPDQLEAQLSYLLDAGWTAITTDQLADDFSTRTCPPAKTFVVSFDDGDLDQYTNAAPLLENLGIRGSFFIIAGRNGTMGAMTNDEVADLASRGHAIGNHTYDHANLRLLDAAQLQQEIEGAEQTLDQILGYRPKTFAYPYGRFTQAVVDAVAASNFELAFTVRSGAVESTESPMLAKRIVVGRFDSGATVLSSIAPFANSCPGPTPDLAIGKAVAGPFRGFHTESSTVLTSQTQRRSNVRVRKTYDYYVQLKNQSNTSDSFSLSLNRAQANGATVKVFVQGTDVTPAVSNHTYVTPTVAPWTAIPIEIQLTTPAHRTTALMAADLSASDAATASVDIVRASASF